MQPAHALTGSLKQTVASNWPVFIGLILCYLPTLLRLADTVWIYNDQAHGPLIFLVVIYLFWLKKDSFKSQASNASRLTGTALLLTGILFYIVGHSQELITLEAASAIPVLMGILCLQYGFQAILVAWFPFFFMCFMVPIPGALLDFVTVPMKMAVSYVAEQLLYWLGYPVARNGVVMQIGQYKLFVADACAGMHTLISLEALGLLYITLVKHASAARNLILGLLIVPISFIANVTRVIALVLVTFYFGDAVAQGFIHQFASIFLFAIALIMIVFVDASIQRWIKRIE